MTTSVVVVNCGPSPIDVRTMGEPDHLCATQILNSGDCQTFLVYQQQYFVVKELPPVQPVCVSESGDEVVG